MRCTKYTDTHTHTILGHIRHAIFELSPTNPDSHVEQREGWLCLGLKGEFLIWSLTLFTTSEYRKYFEQYFSQLFQGLYIRLAPSTWEGRRFSSCKIYVINGSHSVAQDPEASNHPGTDLETAGIRTTSSPPIQLYPQVHVQNPGFNFSWNLNEEPRNSKMIRLNFLMLFNVNFFIAPSYRLKGSDMPLNHMYSYVHINQGLAWSSANRATVI